MNKNNKDIYEAVRRMRQLQESADTASSEGAIPYNDQDEIYKYTIESTRTQFGADYTKSKTPMLYDPKDGDVVLSGIIPSLNNAPFHFRYLEENGCYLWLDSVALSTDVVNKINKILGVYKNWRKEIEQMGDRKPIASQQNNENND